ncbi:MAG: hypothetical protein ACXWUG_25700 [Polyangiales bacterium]
MKPKRTLHLVLAFVAACVLAIVLLRPDDRDAVGGGAAGKGSASGANPYAMGPGIPSIPAPASTWLPPGMDPRPRPEGVDEPGTLPGQNLPPTAFPYPPGSQPLTEGVDPSSAHPEDDPVDAKSGIHAVFQPRKGIVHPPEPIIVDLQVLDAKGKRLAVSGAYARFRADGTTVEGGPWYRTNFSESSLLYTATYSPLADEQIALLKGGRHVFVEVHFEAPNGLGPRTYSTVVSYGRKPSAQLTGKYSDAIVDGSLSVQAGVHVDVPGDYRLIASLYGPDGETAIAFGKAVGTLPVGDTSMTLSFFGKILRDKGIDGPYVLRYLMLFERDPVKGDDYSGETVDHAHTTHPYKAKDFSPDDYKPPPNQAVVVTANDPSQQNKPPPQMTEEDRKAKDRGPGAPPSAAMSVIAPSSASPPSGAPGPVGPVGPVKP